MHLPPIDQARLYLEEAEMRNPGPWVAHSLHVAEAAEIIAEKSSTLDRNKAYILGLLHDIGRREGITGMRHVFDGYRYLTGAGYPDAARICLTHSFPVKDIRSGSSQWDCNENEMLEIQEYLESITYNDYDRLLQLCDSIALPTGYCLLEKRLVEVLMRYQNYNEFTLPKWAAYFEIKQYFEKSLGCTIYDLLPGVIENTFD